MTDNDIIKALECCKSRECPECSRLYNALSEECECRLDLMEKVYDLINRQQAEIERYKGVIKRLENDVKEAQAELKEFKALYVSKVAEMGIKAFAKRLKEKAYYIVTDERGLLLERKVVNEETIDNLVKETTESVNYGSSKTEG